MSEVQQFPELVEAAGEFLVVWGRYLDADAVPAPAMSEEGPFDTAAWDVWYGRREAFLPAVDAASSRLVVLGAPRVTLPELAEFARGVVAGGVSE